MKKYLFNDFNIGIVGSAACLGKKEISINEVCEMINKETGGNLDSETFKKTVGVQGPLRRFKKNISLEDVIVNVSKQAIESSNFKINQIDGLFLGLSTHKALQYSVPGIASIIALRLGVKGSATEVGAGCTAGMDALKCAYNQLICDSLNNKKSNYLVIGADDARKIISLKTSEALLFSVGAGALVVNNFRKDYSLNYLVKQIGSLATVACGSEDELKVMQLKRGDNEYFKMTNPGAIAKWVCSAVYDCVKGMLGEDVVNNCEIFVPHQGNPKMLEIMARKNDIPNIYSSDCREFGNTGAASIILAYHNVVNRIKPNNMVLASFGAGHKIIAAYLESHRSTIVSVRTK